MNNFSSEVLDGQQSRKLDLQLLKSLCWWEKRRITYNLVVFISGIVGLSINLHDFNVNYLLDILVFAIIGNLLYSLGFLLEALNVYYFKGSIRIHKIRSLLFFTGLFFSVILTFFLGILL